MIRLCEYSALPEDTFSSDVLEEMPIPTINTDVVISVSFLLNIPTGALDATELNFAVTAPGEKIVCNSTVGNVTSVPAEEVDGDSGNSISTIFY